MPVLVQIDAFDPITASPISLYAASHDDPGVCHVNGLTWWPVIAKLPTLRYDLFDGSFEGKITAPSSTLALQVEPWPSFGRYMLADARIRLWTGKRGDVWSNWTLRFDGRVSAQPQVADGQASIDFAVDDRWLDTPLLSTYTGTTGVGGDAGLKGQPVPLALGAPRYVSGTLIDSTNSVFQVSGKSINGIDVAMEKLARFGASLGDYASYAALVAATIPAGRWATALSAGMARLGAPPTGQVSFLVSGDNAGTNGWVRKPGQLIRRIAMLSGGDGKIDDASLDALDVGRPYNLSVYVDQQTTARDLIQKVAASVNAVASVSWTGLLFVAPVAIAAASLVLAADGSSLPPVASVKQIDNAAPWKKLAIGAERAWTVHALGDIAFHAALIDTGAYDATRTYREGNIVSMPDGGRWLYTNLAPSAGHAPPDAAYWSSLASGPVVDFDTQVAGTTKPENNATYGAPGASPVGNTTADQVVADLSDARQKAQDARDRIKAVEDAIEGSDLGDSGAANAAKQAAEAARDQANASATTATTKAGDASSSATTAQGFAQQAGTSAQAAAASFDQVKAQTQNGSPNLLANGNFANGLNRWTSGPGAWAPSVYPSLGSYVSHVARAGATNDYIYQDVAIVATEAYSVGIKARAYGGSSPNALISAQFLTAAGATTGQAYEMAFPAAFGDRLTMGPLTPPSNAASIRLFLIVRNATTAVDATEIIVQAGPATGWRDDTSSRLTQASVETLKTAATDESAARATLEQTVTARFAGTTPTPLGDALGNLTGVVSTKATISYVDTSVASEAGARTTAIADYAATANGAYAKITTVAAVQALVTGRTSARFSIAGTSAGGEVLLDLVTDSYAGSIARIRAGTILLEGQVVVDDTLTVRKLINNAAIIPVRVSATNAVQGQWSSQSGFPDPRRAILTAMIYMTEPGLIEAQVKCTLGFMTSGPWSGSIMIDGIDTQESLDGEASDKRGAFSTQGSAFVGAGWRTVQLMAEGWTGMQFRERSLFVKGFPKTTG